MKKQQEKVVESRHYEPEISNRSSSGKKRVAAYCRVSTLQEEQELSFESQCAYYEKVIGEDPELELVGIYGDQGISGLHVSKRPEFKRLISDCLAGKIDEIRVKSVSRFARNAIECTDNLKKLKNHGVRVFFEREGIYSDDTQCEMVLKLMASVAQEESNSMSTSIRWAMLHNNELGNPTRVCCYGYYKAPRKKDKKHVWLINKDEAKRVKLAFRLIAEGKTIQRVITELNKVEEENGGNRTWNRQSVKNMLTNEAYRGDILTSKTCIPDYIVGKTVKNTGQVQQFYIEGHHDPIVSPELFDKVQNILKEERR